MVGVELPHVFHPKHPDSGGTATFSGTHQQPPAIQMLCLGTKWKKYININIFFNRTLHLTQKQLIYNVPSPQNHLSQHDNPFAFN